MFVGEGSQTRGAVFFAAFDSFGRSLRDPPYRSFGLPRRCCFSNLCSSVPHRSGGCRSREGRLERASRPKGVLLGAGVGPSSSSSCGWCGSGGFSAPLRRQGPAASRFVRYKASDVPYKGGGDEQFRMGPGGRGSVPVSRTRPACAPARLIAVPARGGPFFFVCVEPLVFL